MTPGYSILPGETRCSRSPGHSNGGCTVSQRLNMSVAARGVVRPAEQPPDSVHARTQANPGPPKRIKPSESRHQMFHCEGLGGRHQSIRTLDYLLLSTTCY